MSYFNYQIELAYEGLPFAMSICQVNERKTHWHNYIEFILVLDGAVELRLRDERYKLIKDDLFIINDKEIHNIMKTKDKNLLLILQIDIKHYSKYYSSFKNLTLENDYFIKDKNRKRSSIYKEHMAKIVWEHSRKEAGYRLRIGSEVNLLLANIMENLDKVQLSQELIKNEDKKFLKIREIVSYIDKNFENGIDLDSIVDEFYFSKSHLSRFFKDMTGMNFQQYLNYKRLDKASELLLYTNKSITEIAAESGVNNVKTLNRLFRENYDSTPSQYRKSILMQK